MEQVINKDINQEKSMSLAKDQSSDREAFRFLLSRKIRNKLGDLCKQANLDGPRVVRWTDLLEKGLEKISKEDLIHLRQDGFSKMSSRAGHLSS